MGKSVNKCTFIGNLGADPVVRYFPNGDAICQFTLATSSEYKDKQSGKVSEHTEWHNIIAFKKKAEILGEYLRQGSKVYIEGKHRTRNYTDGNGIERFWSEFVVLDFTLLGNPRERQATQSNTMGDAQSPSPAAAHNKQNPTDTANAGLPGDAHSYMESPPVPMDSFDDDIPF